MRKGRSVIKFDKDDNVIAVYPSAREAGRANYMSHSSMRDYCNGKVKSEFTADGYRYEWAEQMDKQ